MKVTVLITALLLLNTGCNHKSMNEDRGFRYSFSIDKIENSNLSRSDAAEALAKGAEQLLDAKGFSQAIEVASEALNLDRNNFRAGFVRIVAQTILLQKGIVARVQPLWERSPSLKKQWDNTVKELKAKPNESLNSFYLDGKGDIYTEKDLQNYIDSEVRGLERFRLFLKKNRDHEITLTANTLFVTDLNARYANACLIKRTPDRSYELICPPPAMRHEVSLNRADFEALMDGATFYELLLALPNGYDLTGSVDSISGMNEVKPSDTQKIADDLMARAEFGSLRIPNTLARARGWGLDLVNSLTWAFENQNLLCPMAHGDPLNRPGFFINKGICLDVALKPLIDAAGKIVQTQGPVPFNVAFTKLNGALLNFFAPYEHPLASLKQLGPMKFDNCGNLTDLSDKTLGGMFPNHDALKYLTEGNSCK